VGAPRLDKTRADDQDVWHIAKCSTGMVTSSDWEWLGLSPEEKRANARLIAAAPELLNALQCLLDLVSLGIGNRRIMQIYAARAAVAKATGETK
jgi:hypothetical protein